MYPLGNIVHAAAQGATIVLLRHIKCIHSLICSTVREIYDSPPRQAEAQTEPGCASQAVPGCQLPCVCPIFYQCAPSYGGRARHLHRPRATCTDTISSLRILLSLSLSLLAVRPAADRGGCLPKEAPLQVRCEFQNAHSRRPLLGHTEIRRDCLQMPSM